MSHNKQYRLHNRMYMSRLVFGFCVLLMMCLHRERQRPIKYAWYRIVWRCSYCSKTETDANFHWVLYILSASVSVAVSVSGSANEALQWVKCCKAFERKLPVTEHFNIRMIAVSDFGAEQPARCKRIFCLTKIFISWFSVQLNICNLPVWDSDRDS